MKLLWVKTDFLHPTTKGGLIRTLEMLRRLHQRHEVHYVAFDNPHQPEGLAHSKEYCSYAYPLPHSVPEKTSPAFVTQLMAGMFSSLPVAVGRYRSAHMHRKIQELTSRLRFGAVVCDFLAPAPNIPDLSACVLFQHNVESLIWQRHVEHASDPVRRAYFRLQARRMLAYESHVCRTVKRVIAVSESDAGIIRKQFGASRVSAVPTGVDIEFFAPPANSPRGAELVFLGSMDWMPNIDGIGWFTREVLPQIRQTKPNCRLTIVGRKPTAVVLKLAQQDPRIEVTGTVDDVRPWLWGSQVSIVPLRIGGGTRLKIYEAMAARIPVVSTTVGAEGLDVCNGDNIYLADTPGEFARCCIRLLEDQAERARLSEQAWKLVATRFSWDAVSQVFEELLVS